MSGEVNVDALLRRITAKQFRIWEAYFALEPFGEIRADYRAASICQMLANVNRSEKTKPYKLEDFLLQFEGDDKKKPQSTVHEKLTVMTVIARAWNQAMADGPANAQAAAAVADQHGVALTQN